jgi:hypothetical protein
MSINLQQLVDALQLEFRGDAALIINGVATPALVLPVARLSGAAVKSLEAREFWGTWRWRKM